jgi:hypothetical protein
MAPLFTFSGVDPANIITRRPLPQTEEGRTMYERMTCDTLVSQPPTPDLKTPDQFFTRDARDLVINMHDGTPVTFWFFEDETDIIDGIQWPSKPMRMTAGNIVHSHVKSHMGAHSIHHHGLEPETINDGVGHISFEANEYTYQFTLRPDAAGTYFYHCHRNTPLHFELGMYGLLIIDPPEGPGRLYTGGPAYDHEIFLVPDDIDASWRDLTSGGFSGGEWIGGGTDGDPENKFGLECNNPDLPWYGSLDPAVSSLFPYSPGLSDFSPEYFMVNGIPVPQDNPYVPGMGEPGFPSTARFDPNVVCKGGEAVLMRTVCAAYNVLKITSELTCTVVGRDGRPLGRGDGTGPGLEMAQYSQPVEIAANSPFYLTTAQRRDLMFYPRIKGVYELKVEFLDWKSWEKTGEVRTTITVTESAPGLHIPAVNSLFLP